MPLPLSPLLKKQKGTSNNSNKNNKKKGQAWANQKIIDKKARLNIRIHKL